MFPIMVGTLMVTVLYGEHSWFTAYAGFRDRRTSRISGQGYQTWASEPCKGERGPRKAKKNEFQAPSGRQKAFSLPPRRGLPKQVARETWVSLAADAAAFTHVLYPSRLDAAEVSVHTPTRPLPTLA